MKICTIGAGFVSDHLNYQKIDSRLDFSAKQIENIIETHKPDVLINCIGKTGVPNVDWCESNKGITSATNIALPIMLADICAKKSIHMIQIGSGCIFFGESPNISKPHGLHDSGWKETDFANPQSFYSKTKYACDLAIGDMSHVTTLRIRMPISSKNLPRNLINKLRHYDKVIDIPNSVTFMDDLVKCVDWAIKEKKTGIFHVTNSDTLTAAQIMSLYATYDKSHKFSIIDESQLAKLTIAKRSNCILSNKKLIDAGFSISPAQETLTKCMSEYIKNI